MMCKYHFRQTDLVSKHASIINRHINHYRLNATINPDFFPQYFPTLAPRSMHTLTCVKTDVSINNM